MKPVTKQIKVIVGSMNTLQNSLEVIRDDAQNKYDEKSDKWRESEAGEKAYELLEALTTTIDNLENDANGLTDCTNED